MPFKHPYKWLLSCVIVFAFTVLMAVTALADDTTPAPVPTEEVTAIGTTEPLPVSESPAATDEPVLATEEPTPVIETPVPTSTDVPSTTPDLSPTPTDTPVDGTPISTVEVSPVVPSATPVPQETISFPAAYSATFEAGLPSELLFGQIWAIVEVPGGYAIQSSEASNVRYLPATFVEGIVEASFFINQGTGGLLWGDYSASLAADNTLTLSYGGTVIQTISIEQLNDSWNTLRLTVTESAVIVTVNGVDHISVLSVASLVPAEVGFWSGEASALRVDNFEIFGAPILETVAPVPSEIPATETAVPTVVPVIANAPASLAAAVPSMPTITSPGLYEFVKTVRPTLTWNPVVGAVGYEVAVVDTQTGQDYAPHQPVSGTQYTVPYNLPQRQISFYVRAGNAQGWSQWSWVGAPIVLGDYPGSQVGNQRPVFSWTAVPDATSYTLQVDNNSDFSSPVIDQTVTSPSYETSAAEAFTTIGATYYWHVTASNLDYPSLLLNRSFTVVPALAEQPVVTSPASGASINNLRPTFTWNPVDGATHYEIAILGANTGLDLIPREIVTGTSFTPSVNLPQTHITFYVRAGNDDGWSPLGFVFASVLLGDGPGIGAVTTTQPTFTWGEVLEATDYTLQVDNDADFSSPVFEHTLTTTSYTVTAEEALDNGGFYYWRVAASNASYPDEGLSREFYIEAGPAPEQPVITSPLPGDLTTSVRPTITWEPVPDATGYEVRLTDNDTGMDYGTYPVVGATEFTVPENLPQHSFAFSVRAERDGSWSQWSSVWAFVMLGETPAYNSIVTTMQPTFTWPVVDGATSYTLQVDDDIEFTTVLAEHTTSETSYTLSIGEALMYPNTQYYWRLSASNVEYPPYGYVRVFATGDPIPGQLAITSPVYGGLTTSVRPTMTWEPVPDAIGYEVSFFDNDMGVDYGTYPVVGATEFTVAENLPQHWFKFSMRAQKAEGWTAWVSVDAFVMLGETPAYDSTVTTLQPTFTWPTVDGATSYTLQVDDDIEFTTLLAEHSTSDTSYTLTDEEALPNPNGIYYWRLSASNVEYPPYGYVRVFYVGDVEPGTPVAAPVITSPLSGTLTTTVRPTITWEPVPDATKYQVRLVDNNAGTNYGPYSVVGATEFTVPENLPQHSFTFSVRAGKGNGWSEWVSVDAFVMLGETPAYDSTVMTLQPTFTWPTVEGATSYTLQIDDNFEFPSPLEITTSDTSYTLTSAEALSNPYSIYYWRLSASNVDLPPYGYVRIFYVNLLPAQPVITSPVSESTLGTVRPTITWDAVSNATAYEVAAVEPGTGIDYGPRPTVTATQYKFTYNLSQGDVDVYVRAKNEFGASEWASLRVRVVLGNTPVSESITTTARPAFKWTSVPGATSYTLQVDNDADFSSPLVEHTGSGTSYTLTTEEALPTQVIRYYWRVAASNVAYPDAALARTFISGVTPAPTNLSASRDGETTPATLFGPGVIQFRWDAPTPAPYGYEVQYSLTSDFASVITQPTSTEPSLALEGFSLPESKIYWRVRTIYNPEFASIGKWSGSKSFTVDLTAPSTPVVSAPTGVIHKARPAFSWSAASGASSYIVSVYDEVTNELVSGFPKALGGTSYTIPSSGTPLNQAGYYWHVVAVDAAGNVSVPTPDIAFTIFSGLTPTPGQSLTDTTPRFTWQSVSGTGAAAWRLEIGTSPQMDTLVYTSAELAASATAFTVPNANALPIGTYYWRVYRVTEDASVIPGQMLSIVAP